MNTFTQNLALMCKQISSYVVLLVTGIGGWWLTLDPATQAGWLAEFPALKYVAPVSALVAFVIAKGIPQKSLHPQPAVPGEPPKGPVP